MFLLNNTLHTHMHGDTHTKMSTQLIINRYGSPLEWLSVVDLSGVGVTVINKGKDDLKGDFKVIKAPNLGIDQDSILTYIISEYDSLPDFSVFVQDEVKPHYENLLDLGVCVCGMKTISCSSW